MSGLIRLSCMILRFVHKLVSFLHLIELIEEDFLHLCDLVLDLGLHLL